MFTSPVSTNSQTFNAIETLYQDNLLTDDHYALLRLIVRDVSKQFIQKEFEAIHVTARTLENQLHKLKTRGVYSGP